MDPNQSYRDEEKYIIHNKGAPCYREQLGFRDECLRELALSVAESNDIIIIPVNKGALGMGDNLRCSLLRIGLSNIMYWALDIEAHDALSEAGHLSYFIPGNL